MGILTVLRLGGSRFARSGIGRVTAGSDGRTATAGSFAGAWATAARQGDGQTQETGHGQRRPERNAVSRNRPRPACLPSGDESVALICVEESACHPQPAGLFVKLVQPLLRLFGVFAPRIAGDQIAVRLFRIAGLLQRLFALPDLEEGGSGPLRKLIVKRRNLEIVLAGLGEVLLQEPAFGDHQPALGRRFVLLRPAGCRSLVERRQWPCPISPDS